MPNRDHERAQELSAAAAELAATGKMAEARREFGAAAVLELKAVRQIPPEKTRTWGILAVSAAALLYKARQLTEAENAIYSFLVHPHIGPDARQQLRELLEVVWDEQSLPPGFEYSGDEFLVSLRGGDVGAGTAPIDLVIEKNAELRSLYTRAVEWNARKPFRTKGPPDPLVAQRIQARATQPGVGSYRFFIRLVAPSQGVLFPDLPTVSIEGVASSLFTFIRLATAGEPTGVQELKRLVPDQQYRSAMLKLIRNIIPTGRSLGEVEITRVTSAPDREPERRSVVLSKNSRPVLSEVMKASAPPEPRERTETVRGTLRAVDLDHDWLVVVREDGTPARCDGAGTMLDDVVGPMVNRHVVVRGRRRGLARKFYVKDIELDPDAD